MEECVHRDVKSGGVPSLDHAQSGLAALTVGSHQIPFEVVDLNHFAAIAWDRSVSLPGYFSITSEHPHGDTNRGTNLPSMPKLSHIRCHLLVKSGRLRKESVEEDTISDPQNKIISTNVRVLSGQQFEVRVICEDFISPDLQVLVLLGDEIGIERINRVPFFRRARGKWQPIRIDSCEYEDDTNDRHIAKLFFDKPKTDCTRLDTITVKIYKCRRVRVIPADPDYVKSTTSGGLRLGPSRCLKKSQRAVSYEISDFNSDEPPYVTFVFRCQIDDISNINEKMQCLLPRAARNNNSHEAEVSPMQQVESGTPLARSNSFDREHGGSGSSDYSVESPTFSSQTQADLFSGSGEEDVLSETGGMPMDPDSLSIQNTIVPPGRSESSTPQPITQGRAYNTNTCGPSETRHECCERVTALLAEVEDLRARMQNGDNSVL